MHFAVEEHWVLSVISAVRPIHSRRSMIILFSWVGQAEAPRQGPQLHRQGTKPSFVNRLFGLYV
jgi:hypothetical protein